MNKTSLAGSATLGDTSWARLIFELKNPQGSWKKQSFMAVHSEFYFGIGDTLWVT